MPLAFQSSLSGTLQRRAVLLGSSVWDQHLRRREYVGAFGDPLSKPRKPPAKVWMLEAGGLVSGPRAKFRALVSAALALVPRYRDIGTPACVRCRWASPSTNVSVARSVASRFLADVHFSWEDVRASRAPFLQIPSDLFRLS